MDAGRGKPRSVDDLITAQEKENFLAWKRKQYAYLEDPYGTHVHMSVRMGLLFGWQALRDYLEGEVSLGTALKLEKAALWEMEKLTARKASYTQAAIAASFDEKNRKAMLDLLKTRLNGLNGADESVANEGRTMRNQLDE